MCDVKPLDPDLAEFVVTLAILQAHATTAMAGLLVHAGAVSEPMARSLLHELAKMTEQIKTSNPLVSDMWADTLLRAAADLQPSLN